VTAPQTPAESPRLSVLIVSHDSSEALGRTLPALMEQLRPGDEVIIVDNASNDGSAWLVAELAPQARLVQTGANRGFPAGVNAAAARAGGELLLILNPDATPQPGFREAIVRPWTEGRGWSAWMGLVACNGGTEVNTAGNPLHFTGLTWAGGHGRPLAAEAQPHEVTIASGACLAITRDSFDRLGGMPERYFLYHEDAEVSMRLHLQGERVGIEPAAIVDHDYEFARSFQKMRFLERNRWLFVLRTYPAPLLLLVMPALLLTELALIPLSIAGGWGREKLLANLDVVRRLPWALRTRGGVQRRRAVSAAEFAAWLTPELDSPFLGRPARARPLRWALRAYWRAVRALLPG
jgi:N-acetylglucosaminyl-diphospho-decaprenol L-rhamnosyltransferase